MGMSEKHQRKHSIFKKIFLPIVCLIILQAVIFYMATVYGGVINELNQNATDILKERVINRKNDIETQFNTRWVNMSSCASAVSQVYTKISESSDVPVYSSGDLQKQVLSEASPALIAMLRNNGVNGVFLIMNDSKTYTEIPAGGYQEKYGLCIRDYDQNSTYTGNEDLLVVRCPSSIISDVGCALETWWEALYKFDSETSGDFYYQPLKEAYKHPDASSDNLSYFSAAHNYSDVDKSVVSFSMPLMDSKGYPYAVIGVELTTTYLESLLPSEELQGRDNGSYVLAEYEEGSSEFKVVAWDGLLFQKCFGNEDTIQAQNLTEDGLFSTDGKNETKLIGNVNNLKIYNNNTPFEDTHLALVGILEENTLFAVSQEVRQVLLVAAVIVLIIGIVGISVISSRMTIPIRNLAKKVRQMDEKSDVRLDHINIDEIDDLVDALEEMSQTINHNQVRTEFFSRMSHDMRTPMNAIIGFSSPEILEGASEENKDEYLEKIQSSGKYLLGLINEVLDMTKIESRKIEIKQTAVSVKQMISQLQPMMQQVASQKGVVPKFEFNTRDLWIYADTQRIGQILMNLFSNAVKFTPEGGFVLLAISTEDESENEVTHKIIVKDTGIGMSEEFQKNMYQPFVQEHSGVVEGTGLGLSQGLGFLLQSSW